MNLLDIAGPVMVGPSSSHTAGACRIGNMARKLLGEPVRQADIRLHGSFLTTGKGHGTDRALVAGLLGFSVDDLRIPDSFRLAEEAGLRFDFSGEDLGNVHPNTVRMLLTGISGKSLAVTASSVGGGRIRIVRLGDLEVNFSGDLPTLIVRNVDAPGMVERVTGLLKKDAINIAAMDLRRKIRGGEAVMILECDEEVPEEALRELRGTDGVVDVTYVSAKEDAEHV